MTVQEIITTRNPNVVISARVLNLITLAESYTGSVYCAQANDATALLVLHWLALDERGAGGASGAITSESEGDLSRSYGISGNYSFDDLMQTVWGMQLKRLRDGMIFAARNRTI